MIDVMYRQGCKLDFSPQIQAMLQHWPADQRLLTLCSGRYNQRWARYCILTTASDGWAFVEDDNNKGRNIYISDNHIADLPDSDPFVGLQTIQQQHENKNCLWLGYLSYDMGRWVEDLPHKNERDRGWEVGVMHRCPGWLVYDLLEQSWTACGTWSSILPDWLTNVFHQVSNKSAQPNDLHYKINDFVSKIKQQTHEDNVQTTLDYIAAGDIFEANIAQRFTAAFALHENGMST